MVQPRLERMWKFLACQGPRYPRGTADRLPHNQAERKRQQRTRGKGPSRTEGSVHCYGFYRTTCHAVPLPPSKVGAQHPKLFPPLLTCESLSGV